MLHFDFIKHEIHIYIFLFFRGWGTIAVPHPANSEIVNYEEHVTEPVSAEQQYIRRPSYFEYSQTDIPAQ